MSFYISSLILIFAFFWISQQQIIEIPLNRTLVKQAPGRILSKYDREGEQRRQLQTFDTVINIDNHYDFQYCGSIFIGSQRQNLTLIFDTGSSWLWITSDKCSSTECPGNRYHYNQSSSYRETSKTEKIVYGKGSVQGYVVSDQVSVTSDGKYSTSICRFLAVYTATQLSGLETDGLVGLSPNFASQSQQGDLLLNSLSQSGTIKKAMFSLQLKFSTSKSRMWIGGYDETTIKSYYNSTYLINKTMDDLIAWMPIVSKTYWQMNMNESYFGNNTIKLNNFKAIFDSGSSLSYIPTADFNQLLNIIYANGVSCSKDSQGMYYCNCKSINDTNYPLLQMKMDKRYTFFMHSYDYLIYDQNKKKCIYTFIEDMDPNSTYWLLGDNFLRAYYTIYDMDNQRVGVAGEFLDSGPPPPDPVSPIKRLIQKYYYYIIAGIGGLIIILFICCLCYCKAKKCCCWSKSKKHIKHKKNIVQNFNYPTPKPDDNINNTLSPMNGSYTQTIPTLPNYANYPNAQMYPPIQQRYAQALPTRQPTYNLQQMYNVNGPPQQMYRQ